MALVISINTKDLEEAKRQVVQAIEEKCKGIEYVKEVRLYTVQPAIFDQPDQSPLHLVAYHSYTYANEDEGTDEGRNLRIEVDVYCASSGSDCPEAQLTKEILEYCGFQNLPERITKETFHKDWFNKEGRNINEERVAWLRKLLFDLGYDIVKM